jgi:hypothetical protein
MVNVVSFQMDPGVKSYRFYTITDPNTNTVGQVLVPKTTGTINKVTYNAGTEYWLGVVNLAASPLPRGLTFSWTDYEWSDTPPAMSAQSFTMPQSLRWTSLGSGYPAGMATNFVNNTIYVVVGWHLTYTNNQWGGNLTWYDNTGQNNVFGGSTSSPVGLTSGQSGSNRVTWYSASVSPTNPT